jgi:hypothetical protein
VEHTFTIKGTDFRGLNWKVRFRGCLYTTVADVSQIYDVGGGRNQRQSWAPYFDDGNHSFFSRRYGVSDNIPVNAIIFLAPISTFDQNLEEDPRVNRLEDSLLLWKSVVANKLLASVNIVLFLNKCDLLQVRRQLDCMRSTLTEIPGEARCRRTTEPAYDLVR